MAIAVITFLFVLIFWEICSLGIYRFLLSFYHFFIESKAG